MPQLQLGAFSCGVALLDERAARAIASCGSAVSSIIILFFVRTKTHSLGRGALLDDLRSLVVPSARRLDAMPICAELLGRELLERGTIRPAGGDGDELQLHAADPADGGGASRASAVVRLVVEDGTGK